MSDENRTTEQRVVYYCSGCKRRIARMIPKARYNTKHYSSYCATAGRDVRMRKSRNQGPVVGRYAVT